MNPVALCQSLSLCAAALVSLGASAAAQDLPVAGDLCPHVLNLDGRGEYLRYCRNRPLVSSNPAFTRALVVIPGTGSNARMTYDVVLEVAREEGLDDTTSIIVPSFLEDDRNASNGTVLGNLGLADNYLFWDSGWRYGTTAVNLSHLSSFEVIDLFVRALAENNPNLEHIAVVGHSAGGQFVNRYAAGTGLVEELESEDITMSFGVFAPGSVLYLQEGRDLEDPSCQWPNRYPFGLEVRNNYMRDTTPESARERLYRRHVFYAVGAEDLDPLTGACHRTQGIHHVDLLARYREHLEASCRADNPGLGGRYRCRVSHFNREPSFTVLPGVGHSTRSEYRSAWGRQVLFYLE